MADIFSKSKRSEIMAKISSKDTKPEILARKLLFAEGFRFRKNDKKLPGKPDIVLPKYKTAVFVHGCFWHGHQGCKKSKLPETRKEFWKKKINANIERDKKNIQLLKEAGWNVKVIWQCELEKNTQTTIESLISQLKRSV